MEGQHEQVPAHNMCIRTTFIVCIRRGEITGATTRGKQPDRSSEDELDPCRCFWNKPADRLFLRSQPRLPRRAVISTSVLPNNQNTVRSRSQQQQVFPTSKEKISATDAISTRFQANRLIISRRRNTSAAIHSSYSFSSPADSLRRFIST